MSWKGELEYLNLKTQVVTRTYCFQVQDRITKKISSVTIEAESLEAAKLKIPESFVIWSKNKN